MVQAFPAVGFTELRYQHHLLSAKTNSRVAYRILINMEQMIGASV
jgi:hypothetical protein